MYTFSFFRVFLYNNITVAHHKQTITNFVFHSCMLLAAGKTLEEQTLCDTHFIVHITQI